MLFLVLQKSDYETTKTSIRLQNEQQVYFN